MPTSPVVRRQVPSVALADPPDTKCIGADRRPGISNSQHAGRNGGEISGAEAR